jgi:threonylcarbamoyladenosine tRNA methylthiotransferase MtaB
VIVFASHTCPDQVKYTATHFFINYFMDIHLKALGCRLNEAELEQWSQEFKALGHRITQDSDAAKLIVLNTCAVTNDAARKSRNLIHRFHRQNPGAKLVVSGCHASLDPEAVAQTLGVDLVVTNQDKDKLVPQVMQQLDLNSMPLMASEPGEASLFSRGRHRAFIKIQDGCRYRCTFCIVTVARGDERSRPERDILDEINYQAEQGIREIILTGVHVGGYGSDIGSNLFGLVKTLLAETDMPRIRFASVEPWDLPEDFFGLFENPRIMPHMHLPLQSGSDAVLRRMARRCKTAEFRSLVEKARVLIPGFNITTDIIVGFPGETEDDWQRTMEYVEEIGFGHLHIFAYSPRAGTKAAGLDGQVPDTIKKQRSRAMHALGEKLKRQQLRNQMSTCSEVLWERGQPAENGMTTFDGYTRNFSRIRTHVASGLDLENQITPVTITGLEGDILLGDTLT